VQETKRFVRILKLFDDESEEDIQAGDYQGYTRTSSFA